MNRFRNIIAPSLLAMGIPGICFAQSLSAWVGLFNIMVGLILTVGIILYFTGMFMWGARLGTSMTNRDEAINILMWAVSTLFVLIVLLGIVQFTQTHTQQAIIGIAVILVIIAARYGVPLLAPKEEKKK